MLMAVDVVGKISENLRKRGDLRAQFMRDAVAVEPRDQGAAERGRQ